MNDQEEILLRQSRWSGRRVVLLYWFAIVFIGTSAAAGLGSTVLLPKYKVEADPHPTIPEPWHASDCDACHSEEVDGWNTTWHAQMVGYYDPNDITMNGSRMSYNDTHYWRTPKVPFGVTPQYWTYNQIFNASGQQCCMTTRWTNVTVINATTGEILWTNTTLYDAGYTSNIWDIGVSCAACHANPGQISLSYTTCSSCHTPGGMQWRGYLQSAHYGSLGDLLASGDINSLQSEEYWYYVGQSTYMSVGDVSVDGYYTITCVTCHDPHDSTVNAGDVSNAMSPWTNPYTGQQFGPGGSQLRAATVNDLCGLCHNVALNASTLYLSPAENHSTLSCTDCHGYTYTPTTYFDNGSIDEAGSFETLNHNWKFGGGEPGEACGLCHGADNATVYATMLDYQAMYGNLTDMKADFDTKLTAAMAAYDTAKATAGADIDKLAEAYALIEEAKDLAEATGLAFHNPELAATVEEERLSLALSNLDDALDLANEALPEPTTTTTTTTTTVPPVETTTTTTTAATSAIGIMSIVSIICTVAIFRRKRY